MSTPVNELTPGDIMEGVGIPNVDDLSDDGPLLIPRDSVESVSSLPKTDGKRRRRSTIWDSFKVILGEKYDNGKERAECLKCKIVYRADTNINGTGMASSSMKFLVLIVILSMAIDGAVGARAGSDWFHRHPKGQVPPSTPSTPSPPIVFHILPKGTPTPPSGPSHGSSPGAPPAH
ncbi:hypothetical protein NE237_008316 [Protea cynaroides]|uniref:BED-type domain-containing protein n=1 Tax=Protea cynaroides TaxID=273540 RepID=A0A9Q0KW95_9MAGN|nr:hypothetical protein NE237_008316 [Protea cynaroides]